MNFMHPYISFVHSKVFVHILKKFVHTGLTDSVINLEKGYSKNLESKKGLYKHQYVKLIV